MKQKPILLLAVLSEWLLVAITVTLAFSLESSFPEPLQAYLAEEAKRDRHHFVGVGAHGNSHSQLRSQLCEQYWAFIPAFVGTHPLYCEPAPEQYLLAFFRRPDDPSKHGRLFR